MLTHNIFNLPIETLNCQIHTSNGPLSVTEAVTLPPNNFFPASQQFLLHAFSNDYDMLIGRKMLTHAKAEINYKNHTVTLYNDKFKLINTNNLPNQNHFQVKAKNSQEPLFRLNHLNDEEKNKLMALLRKFTDIQYYEGDNLTLTNLKKNIQKIPRTILPFIQKYIVTHKLTKLK